MAQNAPVTETTASERPIRLVFRDDDLERDRLTVFFRLVLAIPVLLWVMLRGIAAFVVAFVLWLAVLIEARAPESLHEFVASYLRYATQVSAYVFLAADPYPWFRVQADYPVDLEVDEPVRQGRWSGFFRLVLALPALLLAAALGGGLSSGSSNASWSSTSGETDYTLWLSASSIGGAAAVAAFLAWFVVLWRGAVPRGHRDLAAFAIGYSAQAGGYLMLLTPRYPTSDPALAEPYAQLPRHPVRIVVDDDLERPRLTVVFRMFLVIPHVVWLALWGIAVIFAAIAAWFAALVTGSVPDGLHRFLSAYVRYSTHVIAFLYLVGRRFPGFTGEPGSYGIDVEIDPQEPQNRWKTLFRLVLAVPAMALGSALDGVALVIAFLGWWYALATGRMPEGLRNLGAACLRYSAQVFAYVLLCTERYPCAAPVLREPEWPVDDEVPLAAPGDAF